MLRLQQVGKRFPHTSGKFYLVSCEEAIDDLPGYIRSDPSAATSEKEHVIVALQLSIAGRRGVLLLDPGYHVARVVTVMMDHVYPHTGWFTQSDEPHVRKEYCYSFSENADYIHWLDRETRHGIQVLSQSVVYIARPYLTPVHVTERRNLVYNFRSLLARDTKGHLIAGIYFAVKENANITIFHQDGAKKPRLRLSLADKTRTVCQAEAVAQCGAQLGLPHGYLAAILDKLSDIMGDKEFVKQVLDINREINGISQEN